MESSQVVPLFAIHRLLIINSCAFARVASHPVGPAGSRRMRESVSREGMSGFAEYLGGKPEERRLKLLLPENFSRVSVGWRRIKPK